MNATDSTNEALLAVGEDYQREIDSATEFELYGAVRSSLQNAIDYARSLASFFKNAEKN